MSMSHDEGPRIARFFTNITRLRTLIGKIGESRLIGGPYTPSQLLIGVVVLVVGWVTMPTWGPWVGSFVIVRIFALLVAAGFATWASGQLPVTRRKVHNVFIDAAGAFIAPAAGTIDGQPVRLPAPHQVTGTVLIAEDPLEEDDELADLAIVTSSLASDIPDPVSPAPAPAGTMPGAQGPASGAPVPVSASAPAFSSGLDRLLQQARAKDN